MQYDSDGHLEYLCLVTSIISEFTLHTPPSAHWLSCHLWPRAVNSPNTFTLTPEPAAEASDDVMLVCVCCSGAGHTAGRTADEDGEGARRWAELPQTGEKRAPSQIPEGNRLTLTGWCGRLLGRSCAVARVICLCVDVWLLFGFLLKQCVPCAKVLFYYFAFFAISLMALFNHRRESWLA